MALTRVAVVLAFTACITCVPKTDDKDKTKSTTMTNNISLTYGIKASDEEIILDYKVVNESKDDVYLFTPLVDYRGNDYVPVTRRVYVFMAGNSTVHVTKRLWEVPENIDIYMPEVPLLSKVPAGQTFSERLVIPLPLLVNYPYRLLGMDKAEVHTKRNVKTATEFTFSIGYVAPSDISELKEISFEGRTIYRSSYAFGIQNQILLLGETTKVSVPVQE